MKNKLLKNTLISAVFTYESRLTMCVVFGLLYAAIKWLMEVRFVSVRIRRVTPTAPLVIRRRKAAREQV